MTTPFSSSAPLLQIKITAASAQPLAAFLRKYLGRAMRMISTCHLQELSIAVVGARRMARLHNQYLRIAAPTDVLTFELDHDSRGRVIAGEIVICATVAAEQAIIRKVRLADELLLYGIHGILHLSGYDDRTALAWQAMHHAEDQILAALGIGPIFASGITVKP